MFEVGRDLWSNPPAQAGTLRRDCPGPHSGGF